MAEAESWDDVRLGLKTVLEAEIPGLRVYDKEPEGVLEYPCILFGQVKSFHFNPVLQASAFKGSIGLQVYVQSGDQEEAQTELEKYFWPTGERSLFRAVNTDHTLDGKVNWAGITDLEEDATLDRNSKNLNNELSAVVSLEIIHAVN